MGAPRTARAEVVREALAEAGMSLTQLAKLLDIARSTLRRWLNGDACATAAFSLDDLWKTLGVTGERRARLEARLGVTDATVSLPGVAPTRLASLVQAEMRAQRVSARELARRLKVAPTNVTRWLNGSVARSRLRIEAICDALGLEEGTMRRRELLRMALAGGLALAVAPPTVRTRGLDFDEVAGRLTDVEDTRARGHLAEAWRLAQEPELRWALRRARALERDPRARAIRYRYDFLLATLREQMIPWTLNDERPARVIAIYFGVRDALLRTSNPHEASHELAQLYERVAPLYREMGDYDESLWSFKFALDQRMEQAQDLALAVHLWRNRAHVWAVQGKAWNWREDLDKARGVIEQLPADLRDELSGLVTYSEGEGYKRLGERAGLAPAERRKMMRRAYETLDYSLTLTHEQWAAHEATARLSMAQALVWLDPNAALALLDRLEPAVRASHPTHLSKLELTRARARRALGLGRDTAATAGR